VLSSAINDQPEIVSIRPDERTLGRTRQLMFARVASLVQVYLAGFAAEHLLTQRRPRQLDRELEMALLSVEDPALGDAFPDVRMCDGYLAIQSVLSIAVLEPREIRSEVERSYEIARESLAAVWPAVKRVARALLAHDEIDREGLGAAIGNLDIYSPVFAVQRAHGSSGIRGSLSPAAHGFGASAITPVRTVAVRAPPRRALRARRPVS
jgi:hypothetical protein